MIRIRLAVLGTLILALVGAWKVGLFAQFADPDKTRQTLLSLGGLGYGAYILAYATLQPFIIPGTVFILASALIWPWPIAFALSLCGTMAASVVGFSFARFVARDFISARIPERFQRYNDSLARRGFLTVFVLRLIFWMPPMLHAFFGVSRVSFGSHFFGSLLGYTPPLLLVAYFGRRFFDWLKEAPPSVWGGFAAVLVVAILGFWIWRRRR